MVKLKFVNGLKAARSRLTHQQVVRAIVCGSWIYLSWGANDVVLAQSSLIPSAPEVCEIDLTTLKSTETNTDPDIVTADTASPQGMTLPSLWWPNEQFASKLVTNWIANRRQKQIYLLVGTKSWHVLDYIDRYRTIDRFGRIAQSYGYNLKICDSQKIALARYTCDLAAAQNTPNTCQVWLNSNDQNGMSVQNTLPSSR